MQAVQIIDLLSRIYLLSAVDHHAGAHAGNCWILPTGGEFALGLLSAPTASAELEEIDLLDSRSSIRIGLESKLLLRLFLLLLGRRRRVKQSRLERGDIGKDVRLSERGGIGQYPVDFQIHSI